MEYLAFVLVLFGVALGLGFAVRALIAWCQRRR